MPSFLVSKMLIHARGGKSTLIRALIRNAALNFSDEVPIPGNHAERCRSTSGGVNLYSDPKTIDTHVPLFYAGSFNSNISDSPDIAIQTAKAFGVAPCQWQLILLKGMFTGFRLGNIRNAMPQKIIRITVFDRQ